jgi:rhamnogalacturonan acetylesterase
MPLRMVPALRLTLLALASAVHWTAPARAADAPVPRLASASGAATRPTLFLIGDSTVRNGTKGQMGWGTPIAGLFDPARIRVENRALGGRSSRTYFTEGLWDKVLAELKPGDFVLMQFGHNDGGGTYTGPRGRSSLKGAGDETREVVHEPADKPAAGGKPEAVGQPDAAGTDKPSGKAETVHTYGWYLRRYAADAKAKGASPVILSPVPRNDWKGETVARASNDYGKWAAEAAKAQGVPFVDLNELVASRYEALGRERVNTFFPDEHTHTNAEGAAVNAAAVAEGLRRLPDAPLATYLKPAAEPAK